MYVHVCLCVCILYIFVNACVIFVYAYECVLAYFHVHEFFMLIDLTLFQFCVGAELRHFRGGARYVCQCVCVCICAHVGLCINQNQPFRLLFVSVQAFSFSVCMYVLSSGINMCFCVLMCLW